MYWCAIIFCLFLAVCGVTSSIKQKSHELSTARLHPGLKLCTANPMIQNINKTRLMELEHNEWHVWDMTVLSRMMKLARIFGKGNNYYLQKEFTDTSDYTSVACDKNIPNIAEAMNYIAYPLESLMPCSTPIKLYGANVDSGKKICDAKTLLDTKDCIVYSLGSNNLFDFEESISSEFKQCKIFVFDCTSEPPKTPIENVKFEKICLGSKNEVINGRQYVTIQKLLEKHEHKAISLFKMDIEGYEMEVFDAMLTPTMSTTSTSTTAVVGSDSASSTSPYSPLLPYQLLFETHWWQMSAITSLFHITLFQQLTLAGYRPVDRSVNRDCLSCNEHTFVRVYC